MHRLSLVTLCIATVLLSGCTEDQKPTTASPHPSQEEKPERTQSLPQQNAALVRSQENFESKITRISGRAFLVTDFGKVPDGLPGDVVKNLEKQALAGDSDASYSIYLKINECLNQSSRTIRGLPAQGTAVAINGCDELSPDVVAKASDWLALAADQGNLGAQLLYASDPEAVLGDPTEILRDPDRAKEYKTKSMGYLEGAANQGSVDALLRLGNAYDVGVLTDRDPVLSMAYFGAVRRIDPTLLPKPQITALEKSMTADQLASSQKKGSELYGNCCR